MLMKSLKLITILAALAFSANAFAVKPVNVKVPVNSKGMTIEQKNVADRVIRDNKPGSIKHLYVISAMTGDVLIYSSVKGKVTSSGKRLQPKTVNTQDGRYVSSDQKGIKVKRSNGTYRTGELLGDDGTYGSSVPYVYWFDQKGVYHQHYITGGQIFHVADAPIAVGKAIINMD